MKILGIEASGQAASTALWEDGVLRAEYTIHNGLTHSQTLLPMVEEMLRLSGEELSEADAIAVSAGPGSFTGLRIGAATAKGLALALDLPVIRVSSLLALAENEAEADAVTVPVMDARRGQVYCAAWFEGRELISPCAETIGELLASLSALLRSEGALRQKSVLFCGDGVPVHRIEIEKAADFPVRFASANNSLQRASSTAQLGAKIYAEWLRSANLSAEEAKKKGALELSRAQLFSGDVMNSDELVPLYLRKPQAEREKDAGLLEDPGLHSLRKLSKGESTGRRYRELTQSTVGLEEWLRKLAELDASVFPHSPWGQEAFSQNVQNEYDHVFVCVQEEEILGYALLRVSGDAELLLIGVRETVRRHGVGKTLLRRILPAAGGRRVFLEVRDSNEAAIALYRKFGFEELVRRRGYYKEPKEDALVMKRG